MRLAGSKKDWQDGCRLTPQICLEESYGIQRRRYAAAKPNGNFSSQGTNDGMHRSSQIAASDLLSDRPHQGSDVMSSCQSTDARAANERSPPYRALGSAENPFRFEIPRSRLVRGGVTARKIISACLLGAGRPCHSFSASRVIFSTISMGIHVSGDRSCCERSLTFI